jgi:hypothetical protein
LTVATTSGKGSPSQAQLSFIVAADNAEDAGVGVGCGAGFPCVAGVCVGVVRRGCAIAGSEADAAISARVKNFFIVPPKATETDDVGIVIVTIQMIFATPQSLKPQVPSLKTVFDLRLGT